MRHRQSPPQSVPNTEVRNPWSAHPSTRFARGGEPAVRCRSSPISIVPCRESMRGVASTGKEVLIRLSSSQPKVFVDGQASLVREFEPHGAACILLVDGCPIHGVGAGSHIINAQGTTSQSRSLLSMARLNSARSRLRSAIRSFVRMDQT